MTIRTGAGPAESSEVLRGWRSLSLGLALVLVLGAGVLATASQRRLLGLVLEVEQSDQVLLHLIELFGALTEAETGQRGYVITGDPVFLEPVRRARVRLPQLIDSLGMEPVGNDRLPSRVDSLSRVLAHRLAMIDSTIEGREVLGAAILTDAARFRRGQALSDAARALIGALQSDQQRLSAASRARVSAANRVAGLLVWGALGGSVIVAGLLVFGMRTEVTRRAQRTAALSRVVEEQRRATELLEGLFTQSTFAIIALDADYLVVLWNPAAERMFGVPAGEVLGREGPLLESPPDQAPGLDPRSVFTRAASGERLHNLEVRRFRRDGTIIDLVVSTVTLYTAAGKPRGVVEIIEDVTDRKRVNQQLVQAQKMEAVGQLTGGIAHDFNNLLAAIVGNLDMLTEQLAGHPAGAKLARLALEAALRGANLTRQLLAFSRRQPLQPRPMQLNTLINELDELLHRTLGEAIEVQTRLQPDLWIARVDPTQVETAILNLAVNARDAMPRGGRLTIETANRRLDQDYAELNPDSMPGDYTMLGVSDTGTGILPEVLPRVFDPFFTTKEPGKGSGLGLSMVYGFARQSGGHVKIYSEVGHGTTVRLYLPRSLAPGELVAPKEPAGSIAPGRGETILVVEDSAAVRDTAANLLEGLGYRVLTADRADAAMDLLNGGAHVDLLFTDIVMPGGVSGVDLARMVRARWPGIKVVFTTGFSDDVLPAGLAGPDPMLVKPYQRHELARLLRTLLD